MTVLACALAAPCLAQTYPTPGRPHPSPYGADPGGVPAAIADQHRYENDRLRAAAQANADLARQQQAQTRSRLRDLQAARAAAAPSALPARPLDSPAGEQAPRPVLPQPAPESLQQTTQGLNQIDAWLDGPN